MIIAQTPFRVSLFGGGTDFPDFYRQNGGKIIAATIDKYCYIAVHPLEQLSPYKFRASYSKTESVKNVSEFKHPLIRESLKLISVPEGVEISHIADLPGRLGLGSSSAFTVGLLNALHAYRNETINPETLAREAITVERERVKDAGGHQDQYVVAHGGILSVDFGPQDKISVNPLNIPDDRLKELEQKLILFFVGERGNGQTVLNKQRDRIKSNTEHLKTMLELAKKANAILLSNEPLDELGKLLAETWGNKKNLADDITNKSIDSAYDAAIRAGALGGKVLGAGGGGFLLVYAPKGKRDSIKNALSNLPTVDFKFTDSGSRIILR